MSRRLGAAPATLAANIANLAFGVITGVISARGLSPEDRGIFIALILWSGLIAAISLLGIEQAIVFRGGGAWMTAISQSRAVARATALQLVPFLVVSLAVNLYLVRHHPSYLPLAFLASFTIPLNAVTQLGLAPLLAGQRHSIWNSIRLLPSLVYAVGAAALLLSDRFSLVSGICAWALGGFVAAVAALRFLIGGRASQGQPVDIDALRRYGRGVTVAGVPSLIRGRIDQLVLGIVAAPHELGVYAVAVSLAAVADVFVVTGEQLLFPKLVARPLDSAQIRRLALVASVLGLSLVLPAAFLGGPVIRLVYGAEYLGAVGPLVVLIAGVAVRLGVVVLSAQVKARHQLAALIRAELVALVVSCGMIAVLWPLMGQLGAAAAVVGGQIVAAAMMWFAVGKEVLDEPRLDAAH